MTTTTATLLPTRDSHSYNTPPNSQDTHPQYNLFYQRQSQPYGSHQPLHHSPTQHFLHSSHNSNATGLNSNSASSRSGSSPVSPRRGGDSVTPGLPSLPLASCQTRPPKSPLYIPAALRPTDRSLRAQPLTPPHSIHGSTDSLYKPSRATVQSSFQTNNANYLYNISNATHGSNLLHHRNTSSINSIATNRPASRRSMTIASSISSSASFFLNPSGSECTTNNDLLLSHIPPSELDLAQSFVEDLPTITGPPTREDWKPDVNATMCDHLICQKNFGLFERRHHCRHCGNVFCNEHSAERVPLDQNASFHPQGRYERCCQYCARQWVTWMEDRVGKIKTGEIGPQASMKGNSTSATVSGAGAHDTAICGSDEAAEVRAEARDEGTRPMVAVSRKTADDSLRMSLIASSVNNEWSTF